MVLSELTKFSSDTSYGSDSPDSSSLLSFKISLSKSINIFESSTYLSSSKKVDSSTMIYWNDSSVLSLTSSSEPNSLSKEIVVCPRDGADCSTSQSNTDPSSEPLSLASTGSEISRYLISIWESKSHTSEKTQTLLRNTITGGFNENNGEKSTLTYPSTVETLLRNFKTENYKTDNSASIQYSTSCTTMIDELMSTSSGENVLATHSDGTIIPPEFQNLASMQT